MYILNLKNKKIYLKNSLIPYSNYDKIETKWDIFINKEIYYEVEEKNRPVDAAKVTEEMYSNKIN